MNHTADGLLEWGIAGFHCAIALASIVGLFAMTAWNARHDDLVAHDEYKRRVRATAGYLKKYPKSVRVIRADGDAYLGPDEAASLHECQCRPCARVRRDAGRAASIPRASVVRS